ncbi:MAG: BrnT family toxin [Deltaproteobacteria bacterium]|nr:BrnT family toxin [Deltaproteobacteria bacterium]
MLELKESRFDWDLWNIQKNELKHGVSALEAESSFYDEKHKIFEDLKHTTGSEKRYILYGKGLENRVLTVGFTLRKSRLRIITARTASRKERKVYEEKTARNRGL